MRFTDKHSDVVGKGYDVNLLIPAFNERDSVTPVCGVCGENMKITTDNFARCDEELGLIHNLRDGLWWPVF